jgi:hypothetical protein
VGKEEGIIEEKEKMVIVMKQNIIFTIGHRLCINIITIFQISYAIHLKGESL